MASVRMRPKRSLHLMQFRKKLGPGMGQMLGDVESILRKEVRRNLSGRVLNKRTGLLHSGLESVIRTIRDGVRLEMGFDLTKVPYARIHELGGRTGRNHATRIPKRPYLRRALVDKKRQIRNKVARFIVRLARGR